MNVFEAPPPAKVRLVGLSVRSPGVIVTLTVFAGQPAASVIVIVALADVDPFLLPETGVTVKVAFCVPEFVKALAVTVATVTSLDVAFI